MNNLRKPPAATELAEVTDSGQPDPISNRINLYRESALNKADDLEANLGVINATMMEMAYQVRQQLEDVNEHLPDSPQKRELLRGGFDDYLRVAKQIERYSTIVIRIDAAPKATRLPPIQ
jgi:hypothetical protein